MDLSTLADPAATPLPMLLGSALAMGALHGLEPGHSKTMMAAFIIAVHGTATQAAVLGLSAAVSHSAVVWVLGLTAASFGAEWVPESLEPWFLAASGLIVMAVGCWILLRMIAAPDPCARLDGDCEEHGHHHHDHPHDHDHDHDHAHADAHALAHARAVEMRFSAGHATMGQTVLFGLSGGLIPCPAAITVLIVCLHLDRFWLGFGVVSAFSLGLAVTLVAVGGAGAVGLAAARRGSPRIDAWLAKAPYLSGGLILAIGLIMTAAGWRALPL